MGCSGKGTASERSSLMGESDERATPTNRIGARRARARARGAGAGGSARADRRAGGRARGPARAPVAGGAPARPPGGAGGGARAERGRRRLEPGAELADGLGADVARRDERGAGRGSRPGAADGGRGGSGVPQLGARLRLAHDGRALGQRGRAAGHDGLLRRRARSAHRLRDRGGPRAGRERRHDRVARRSALPDAQRGRGAGGGVAARGPHVRAGGPRRGRRDAAQAGQLERRRAGELSRARAAAPPGRLRPARSLGVRRGDRRARKELAMRRDGAIPAAAVGAAAVLLAAALAATAALATAVLIPAPAFGGARAAAGHTVALKDVRFRPGDLVINRGDSVTWLWEDHGIEHNVTFRGFRSRTQSSGSYTVRFTRAGTFAYTCTLHAAEGMRGRITVR